MGIISKGAKCNVTGCDKDASRSLNTGKVEDAGLSVSSSGKKTALCKDHYKEWKNIIKKSNKFRFLIKKQLMKSD